MNHWCLVSVRTPHGVSMEAWESFLARVLALGCEGFEERGETPCGAPACAIFTFAMSAATDDAVAGLVADAALSAMGAESTVSHEVLPERDWGEPWREHYAATRATRRIWVGPPEEAAATLESSPGVFYIQIEYAPVFGTGGHATTRACLQLLENHAGECHSLLDIGTGTGVLCFAAIHLGAEYAIGMDIDPGAPDSFRRNARLNGMEDRAHFIAGGTVREAVGGALLHGRPLPDVIACNMLSDAFDGMLEDLRKLRRPMILSGFLVAEGAVLAARLAETGWDVKERMELDEWGAWWVE